MGWLFFVFLHSLTFLKMNGELFFRLGVFGFLHSLTFLKMNGDVWEFLGFGSFKKRGQGGALGFFGGLDRFLSVFSGSYRLNGSPGQVRVRLDGAGALSPRGGPVLPFLLGCW